MDDEVREWIVLGEVVWRDVAGRVLANPDNSRGTISEQLRADAKQVQVRQVPCGCRSEGWGASHHQGCGLTSTRGGSRLASRAGKNMR